MELGTYHFEVEATCPDGGVLRFVDSKQMTAAPRLKDHIRLEYVERYSKAAFQCGGKNQGAIVLNIHHQQTIEVTVRSAQLAEPKTFVYYGASSSYYTLPGAWEAGDYEVEARYPYNPCQVSPVTTRFTLPNTPQTTTKTLSQTDGEGNVSYRVNVSIAHNGYPREGQYQFTLVDGPGVDTPTTIQSRLLSNGYELTHPWQEGSYTLEVSDGCYTERVPLVFGPHAGSPPQRPRRKPTQPSHY